MSKTVNLKVDLNKAMEEKKVLSGLVTACEDYTLSPDVTNRRLLVQCLDDMIIIDEDDIVMMSRYTTTRSLIGEKINFTIKAVYDGVIYGSMKEAKEIVEKPILDKLLAGEVLKGVVTYITSYGAYISIDGKLSGFMKNYDFSDDGTEIREIYSKYSEIKVKYKKTTQNGNILFLPEEKRKGKVLYNAEDIKPGQYYKGRVTNITPDFQWVTVTISSGLTVGCYFPQKMPYLKTGNDVIIKIGKVEYNAEKNRYYPHGKIDKIIAGNNTSY